VGSPIRRTTPATAAWGADEVRRAALTDRRASCLVDTYQRCSWTQLLDTLAGRGPGAVLRQVRENRSPRPAGPTLARYKASDDATAAYVAT
jgi:hypothetical protein